MTALKKLKVESGKLRVRILSLLFAIFAFSILNSQFSIPKVYAQFFDLANTYQVADTDAKFGDIIASDSDKGLIRARVNNDNKLFGVVIETPAIVFQEASGSGKPISRSGDTVVNVTNFNGDIKPGDHITSSSIPGFGMKSTVSGYVLGIATSAVTNTGEVDTQGKKYKSGQVNVALRIEYAELTTPKSALRGFEYLAGAFLRNVQDPERFTNVVKSVVAGMIALASFIVGFFAFSRAIAKGVEAIGRNPLAKKTIQASIVIQLVLTVFTTLAGIVAAFLVLRL